MKVRSKLLACVLAMVCVLASGFTFAETGVTQDTIKVGVISDLTGPAAINLGGWGWVGLILTLIFWVGLISVLAILVVWAVRRARVRAATAPNSTEQPTAKEVLQAQYARVEITREQYKLRKQEI